MSQVHPRNIDSETKQMWLWAVLLPLFTFVGLNMCVWPFPRQLEILAFVFLWLAGFTIFPFLIAIPMCVYFTGTGFVYWKRGEFTHRISKALSYLCFIILWIIAFGTALSFRHQAFVRASKVGDQIVHALTDYKRDEGKYPDRLEQLMPKYLEKIPFTGLIGYPEFVYRKDFNDLQPKDGEYELRINCTSGGINFDRFIYWPSETYPDRIQDNGVERIGAWAYVHE